MFLRRETLNPNNENYLVKTIGSKLYCVIHDSATTVKANLIFLANKPTPDSLIQHPQWIVTSICLLCWSSGLKRKLPWKSIKSSEVYANKAWKIKCYISLHPQEDQWCKSLAIQATSLDSRDLFSTVLVYVQEQQNCFHKTWYIYIEIVSNGCSRRFKDTHREKALSSKTRALSESMNMDIWVVGTSNQLFIVCSYTETKCSKKKIDTGKAVFFVTGPFWEGCFVWVC